MKTSISLLAAAILSATANLASADILVGTDLSSTATDDPELNVLFSANRGSNGGGDQSLQFGDILRGGAQDDVLIGALGIDILFGGAGNDVIVGGTEDFNPFNRDRAFGEEGDDIFLWAPGDGNDFFDGGDGTDVVFLTLIGEEDDSSALQKTNPPFFAVSPPGSPGSGEFDGIFIDPITDLPVVNVPATPGFCEVLDQAAEGMDELNLDHLVQFILSGPANAFDEALLADPNVDPDTLDTGLRIALHLKNVEFAVCNARDGNAIDVFDLRQSPVVKASVSDLPETAYQMAQFRIEEDEELEKVAIPQTGN